MNVCGCEDIPVGDCDCSGNQTDAVGVCGGDCAADADETASAMHLKDALMQARTTSPLTPKTTMAHANLIWWRSPAWVIWISVGALI